MTTCDNYEPAVAYARAMLLRPNIIYPYRSVVIFDIDGTLLDYSGKPIPCVIELYNLVLERNLIPIIMTARLHEPLTMDWTRHQLAAAGIKGYERIYFRQPYCEDVTRYKLEARKHIWDSGFHVVMSIGDNIWDVGVYGGIDVLLTDPKFHM